MDFDFNDDELELFRMISQLKPYDVMQISINQNGERMSVEIKNTAKVYESKNSSK